MYMLQFIKTNIFMLYKITVSYSDVARNFIWRGGELRIHITYVDYKKYI